MVDRPRRPATMLDVARRAGVSRSLVSTVFRGVPGASPQTRERVLQAAADLGYRPDERARKLRSFTRTDIGVAITAINPFHVFVTESLHESEHLRGYQLAISWVSEARTLANAVEALLEQRCAALVLVGPTATEEEIETLRVRAGGVPIVITDRYLTLPSVDALRVDDTAALRKSVAHLVGLGHTEITYIDGGTFVSAEPRRAAYLTAMTEQGLEPRIVDGGGTRRDGALAAAALVDGGVLPSALVAYNDQVAFGAMAVLNHRGIAIPDDVSIVGFDDVDEADLPDIALTTVQQDPNVLAEATARTLLARIDGGEPGGLHLLPPGPLVIRGTTGPPRSPGGVDD